MNTEAKVNEEIDIQQEITMLREQNDELRKQLILLQGIHVTEPLSKEEEKYCKNSVKSFLNSDNFELQIDYDIRKIQMYFKLMKQAVLLQQKQKLKAKEKENCVHQSALTAYEKALREKDEKIANLQNTLQFHSEKGNPTQNLDQLPIEPSELLAFQIFLKDPQNTTEIDYFNQQLQKIYDVAKHSAESIDCCQKNILNIRKEIEKYGGCDKESFKLTSKLTSEQEIYRESLNRLDVLKKEAEYFKHGLEQSRAKALQIFRSRSLSEQRKVLGENSQYNISQPEKESISSTNNIGVEVTESNLTSVLVAESISTVQQENSEHKKDYALESNGNTLNDLHTDLKSQSSTENIINNKQFETFLRESDSPNFIEFMKTVPLTGDTEIDEEIFNFYRNKFNT